MNPLALLFFFLLLSHILAEGNEPQFRKPVNCAKQRDGNYVWGCSRFYSICTNGRELPMQCYTGLKLNPNNNQCDSPENIAVCQDGSSSSITLYRSKDPFSCAEENDGSYEASPCSPSYIQCVQGRRFDQTCPNGLVFNSKAGVCDFASKCKKLRRRLAKKIAYSSQQPILEDSFSDPDSPVAPQAPFHYPYGQGYQQNQQQPNQDNSPVQDDSPSQQPPFNCADKVDGVYVQQENPCDGKYWKCANNQAFLYNCSSGLVYNDQNGQCDYPQYVVACGGTPPDSTTTPLPPPPINAPPFDCTAKTDALYAEQNCNSSYFYSCVGGTSTAMACGHGLVFDTLANACEYPESCGKPTTTLAPQQQDPIKPNLEHGTSGYYFSGNKQYFNVAYPQQHAPFQAGNQQESSQPPLQQQIPSESIPAVANLIEGPPSPGSSSSFNCAGKQSGYYVKQQCTSEFFTCSNGVSTRGICPDGLVFDVLKAQCEFHSDCGQPMVPSSNSNQPQIPVGQTVIEPAQQPSFPLFNCVGRTNGYYVQQQCTPDFFSCSNGMSTKITCPDGLVFDIQKAQCEFQSACSQSEIPSSSNSLSNNQIPPATQQQIPINSPSEPNAGQQQLLPIDCGGLKDGYYYKQPCQRTFVICASGNAVVQQCPVGTLFEPSSAQCQHANQCEQQNNNMDIQNLSSQQFPFVNQPKQQIPQQSAFPPSQQPISSNIISAPSLPQEQESQPEATHVPSSGFSCSGKRNGHYFQQPCQPNWIICAGGQTLNQSCPNGLVFDPAGAQCEFPSLCGKSSGNSPNNSPSPPSSSSSSSQPPSIGSPCGQCPQSPVSQQPIPPAQPIMQPSPQIPQSPNHSNFCQGKQDGNYLRIQCQSTYVVCSGGVAQTQTCPSGLLFDADTAQCEFPAQCGKSQQSQTTSQSSQQVPNVEGEIQSSSQPTRTQPSQSANPQPNQQIVPINPNVRHTPLPPSAMGFRCSGRIDGYYYRTACTPHFFTCVGGHATQLTCPGNLVFDPSKALCQYPQVCGQSSQPDSTGIISLPQPAPPTVNFNCQGKRNGYYVKKGCTPQFYTCLGGMATKLTCPGNLVFDPQSASCQYPDICANKQQMMPNTAPSSSSSGVPANASPSQPSQPQSPIQSTVVSPPTSNFDCSGKTNGAYPMGQCVNEYTICSNGFAHHQRCPGQLVFSPSANNTCDFIMACQSSSINNSLQQPQVNVGTVPNSPLTPVQGNQQPNSPGNQKFPSNAGSDIQQQIPIPNVSTNQQQITSAPANPLTGQGVVQGQQLPLRPINQPSPIVQPSKTAFCPAGNKSEGMHAQGCNNHFYACSGGTTTQMNCPIGLFFDEETQQCDMRELIVACGGQKSQTTQHSSQGEQPNNQPFNNNNNTSLVPIPPSEFDCSSRAIGYYSKGCSSRYYSCTGITVYAFDCPSGLKYDQEAGQCEYESNVPECGGTRSTTPAPVAPPSPQQQVGEILPEQPSVGGQPNAGSQPQPMSGQHPQQPMTNPCGQLPNGIYGPACSPYYFVCYNGAPYDYLCPEGFTYHNPIKACLPTQQVTTCTQ